MPITILLVDDHKVFRDALKRTLEGCPDMLVVAEASDGIEAVELAERHRPDVAIVDIGMRKMNGIEATVDLLRRSPETAVLMLTVYNDEHYIASAAAAGARAYLTKDSLDEAELVQTIQTVQAGGTVFPSAARSVGLDAASSGRSGIRGR